MDSLSAAYRRLAQYEQLLKRYSDAGASLTQILQSITSDWNERAVREHGYKMWSLTKGDLLKDEPTWTLEVGLSQPAHCTERTRSRMPLITFDCLPGPGKGRSNIGADPDAIVSPIARLRASRVM